MLMTVLTGYHHNTFKVIQGPILALRSCSRSNKFSKMHIL